MKTKKTKIQWTDVSKQPIYGSSTLAQHIVQFSDDTCGWAVWKHFGGGWENAITFGGQSRHVKSIIQYMSIPIPKPNMTT